MVFLFRDKDYKHMVIGLSCFLHALAGGVNYISKNSPLEDLTQILAFISLMPIVICAENFKKMMGYLILAVSPMAVVTLLLLVAVMVIGILQGGGFDPSRLGMVIGTPMLVTLMFILIAWPFLLIALGARIGLRWKYFQDKSKR